jgi:hypothetical protein
MVRACYFDHLAEMLSFHDKSSNRHRDNYRSMTGFKPLRCVIISL